jgi:flagellar hook protein FlgE
MATSTKNFDWSVLTRNSIITLMQSLSPEIVKQPLPVDQFHKKVTGLLKKYIPVRVRKSFSPKVDRGFVYVGGCYYSGYDEDYEKCIEVLFQYRANEKIINLTSKRFASMCTTIADTLLHEIIHMRQFRRRNFKYLPDYASNAEKNEVREEQGYLGCSDEIDAYGFNIACELMDKFGKNRKQVINYLNENQKGKKRRHNSWRMYLKAFEHDHNHPILQRVKKKVVRYLPAAEAGKPYRNKDWINW